MQEEIPSDFIGFLRQVPLIAEKEGLTPPPKKQISPAPDFSLRYRDLPKLPYTGFKFFLHEERIDHSQFMEGRVPIMADQMAYFVDVVLNDGTREIREWRDGSLEEILTKMREHQRDMEETKANETLEQHEVDVFEFKHELALCAIEIENALASGKTAKEISKIFAKFQTGWGENATHANQIFKKVMCLYFDKKKEVNRAYNRLSGKPEQSPGLSIGERIKACLARLQKSDKESAEETEVQISPDELGKKFFIERVKHDPRGEVKLVAKEAYFILYFTNEEDFYEFMGNKSPAGGAYMHHISPPCLLIDCSGRDIESPSAKSTVEHELQHFVYDLFDMDLLEKLHYMNPFRIKSLGKKEAIGFAAPHLHKVDSSEASNYRGFKNEVLARIRTGDINFDVLLNGPEYKHLYMHLNNASREKIRELLLKITDVVRKVFFRTKYSLVKDKWKIITYQLMDVPLERMPSYLEKMKLFYRERIQRGQDLSA